MWAGRDYGANGTSLTTYNATPSFAWRINDMISVGLGVQIQYGDAKLNKGLPFVGAFSDFNLEGTGWGYGFTAGVTVTPTPTTTIGLGYRSAVNQKINGTMTVVGPLGGSVHQRFGQHDARSPRRRVARSEAACRSAMDFARHGRMDELEPNWHLRGGAGVRRAGDDQRHRRHCCHSSFKTAGSSRSAPNISGTTNSTLRAGVGLREIADHRSMSASRSCRITTATGCRSAAPTS